MKRKKKLKLNELRVQSFVTKMDDKQQKAIKGGKQAMNNTFDCEVVTQDTTLAVIEDIGSPIL